MTTPQITVVQYQHLPVTGTDGRLHTVTRVGIRVGTAGPFYRDFPAGQDDANMINLWKQQMAQQVMQVTAQS